MTTSTTTAAVTRAVGTAHTRVEGLAKVTGAARYAGEVPDPELAHGWMVLSTVARGRVRAVEDAPVLGMPGVLTVLHHGNAPRLDGNYMNPFGLPDPVLQLFQHDQVPYGKLAGGPGRRRNTRAGQGSGRGARGRVRRGAARRRVLRRTPRDVHT